jgi:hypothetical protein
MCTQNLSTKMTSNIKNQKYSNSNSELVIWENKNDSNNENSKLSTSNRSVNQINKDLLRQIESIEPDYEQRKLAIEVRKHFICYLCQSKT